MSEPFELLEIIFFEHDPAVSGKRGNIADNRPYEIAPDDFPHNIVHNYYVRRSHPDFPVGGHYHRRKVEIMMMAAGRAVFELVTPDGVQREIVLTEFMNVALIVRPGTWHRVRLEEGAVLAVAASTPYAGRDDDFTDIPTGR